MTNNDERSHVDTLSRANRHLLEQMRAMKTSGDEMAVHIASFEQNREAAQHLINHWLTASDSLK